MANSNIGRAAGAHIGGNQSAPTPPPTKASVGDNLKILMREQEAAARLGLKVATLRRWRWSCRGPPFVKIGAAVRYDPDDIESFIDAGRRSSTSDPGQAA